MPNEQHGAPSFEFPLRRYYRYLDGTRYDTFNVVKAVVLKTSVCVCVRGRDVVCLRMRTLRKK